MISITSYVTGGDIAREMSNDTAEAAQFFPDFASRIDAGDAEALLSMLKDEMFGGGGHDTLRRLGELLIEASK